MPHGNRGYMLILEYKLRTNHAQRAAIDEAIRTAQFIRNKCLRVWMDTRGVSGYDLQALCSQLALQYPFAAKLDAQARQASADRAWQAIARFFKNCREHKPGKKGYPRFQHDNRSVEYKVCGWKLGADGTHIRFTDRHGIGTLRLIGTRSIEAFPTAQIKRVRILKRADGYYCQFAIQAERQIAHEPTGVQVGIDMGLKSFSTDSEGGAIENPRFLRTAETKLKRLHRRKDRKQKGSKNRRKAIQRLAKGYLKVSRQRQDFARKQARALIFLRQKTPPFRAGDEGRSGSPCARLSPYRRACGNLRLWSGGDNQATNARVSRSQRSPFGVACLVRCEQPRNPLPLGMGSGQSCILAIESAEFSRFARFRALKPSCRPKWRRWREQTSTSRPEPEGHWACEVVKAAAFGAASCLG